jgi:uncharacterized membrane protein YtjA (UPF0391 family)
MDLFDIFSGQESWHTRRLLELAKTLNDEQLDCPLKNQVKVFPWTSAPVAPNITVAVQLLSPAGWLALEGIDMLHWSLMFLIIALIAGILGFGGIAGAAVGIAKILFFVFLVVWLVALLLGRRSV